MMPKSSIDPEAMHSPFNTNRGILYLSSLNFENDHPIECVGWRRHSSLIFLVLLFTKPNMEVSGWLYQTKTYFTHIVYQPFSRVSPPSFTLYGCGWVGSDGCWWKQG